MELAEADWNFGQAGETAIVRPRPRTLNHMRRVPMRLIAAAIEL